MRGVNEPLRIDDYLNPLDEDELQRSFASSRPFGHVVIPRLLRPEFLREVCASYPGYAEARTIAQTEFRRVNENLGLGVAHRVGILALRSRSS